METLFPLVLELFLYQHFFKTFLSYFLDYFCTFPILTRCSQSKNTCNLFYTIFICNPGCQKVHYHFDVFSCIFKTNSLILSPQISTPYNINISFSLMPTADTFFTKFFYFLHQSILCMYCFYFLPNSRAICLLRN